MSSFKEKAYLQPYGLFLCSTQLQPISVQIGQLGRVDVSYLHLERVWAVNLSIDPPEARDYARFSGILEGDSISILSCWTSEERPVEQVMVTGEIWGIEKRTWEGLVTQPFWFYLLQESLFHIENEDHPVAILMSAIAFEWFLYAFLEEELHAVKGWDSGRIREYVRETNILYSIKHKIQLLVGDILGFKYSDLIYNAWAQYVHGPRNDIMHGNVDIYQQYKSKSAIHSVIAAGNFILELLNFVEADDYLLHLKKDLAKLIDTLGEELGQT